MPAPRFQLRRAAKIGAIVLLMTGAFLVAWVWAEVAYRHCLFMHQYGGRPFLNQVAAESFVAMPSRAGWGSAMSAVGGLPAASLRWVWAAVAATAIAFVGWKAPPAIQKMHGQGILVTNEEFARHTGAP